MVENTKINRNYRGTEIVKAVWVNFLKDRMIYIKRLGSMGLLPAILAVFAVGAIGFGSYRFLLDPTSTQTMNVPPAQAEPAPPAQPAPVASAQPAPVASAQPAPVASAQPAPVASAQPTPVTPAQPAPVASAQPAPAPPAAATSMRLRIPSINVNAEVVAVGLTADGAMAAPPGYDHVGWYELGARPGQPGKAVIAGHVDSRSGPAVFWDLKKLAPGDVLLVDNADGQGTHSFTIRKIDVYEANNAPLQEIFGPSDVRELILITCGGIFDQALRDYSHRVVIYASY